jgi:hypothetical protein
LSALRGRLERAWSSFWVAASPMAEQSPAGGGSVAQAAPIPLPSAMTAADATPPVPAAIDGDTLAQVVAHLEYFGYAVQHEPDGWSSVTHPDRRYHFYLRVFLRCITLDCRVGIGASIGNSRDAWLNFLNDANNRSAITRLALVEQADNIYVQGRALVAGVYSRPVFAMAMNMWHDDLDIIMRRPQFVKPESAVDVEDAEAVTVN